MGNARVLVVEDEPTIRASVAAALREDGHDVEELASGEHLERTLAAYRPSVVDDGPGVQPADRERVFGRLVRLSDRPSAADAGAALGLPIARGIARAHGGDILLLEPHGPGARFRLTLPTRGAGLTGSAIG